MPDAPYLGRAIRLGFPGSLELAAHGLALIAMSVMVTRFGTIATAAYGVGLIVLQIVTIPAMGLATAAAAMVGQAIGAGRTERAARVMTVSAICGFAILSLGGVLAYGLAPWIIAFFVPGNEAVIAEGSGFIRIMCLTWGGIGIQLAIASSFRASGNMLAAMTLVLVSQWLLQLPLAYVLSTATALQAQGLWWSFPVANIAVAALAIHWFSRGGWKAVPLTAPAQPTIPSHQPEKRDMTNPFEAPDAQYLVLRNDELQYSLWPSMTAVPAGWDVRHGPGARAACIEYIETHWTDMRPRSLVAAMEKDAAD